MITSPDWLFGAVVGTSFILIFALAEWLYTKGVTSELTRKLTHCTSGCITLFFPSIFSSHWIVLLLTVIFILGMMVAKSAGLLRSLHDVDRSSLGDLLFPAGIYLTLLLTTGRGQASLYVPSIYVLVAGDAFAAIIGKHFGRKIYWIGGSSKTLLGSFVLGLFSVIGFAVCLPVGHGPHSILILIVIAMFVGLLEAVSANGFDNLLLPLSAAVLSSVLMTTHQDLVVVTTLCLIGVLLLYVLSALRKDVRLPITFALAAVAAILGAPMLLLFTAIAFGSYYVRPGSQASPAAMTSPLRP